MNCKLIARVSTETQDADIMMKALREYAKLKDYRIVGEYWIKESAVIDIEDRKDFIKALEDDRNEDIVIINKLDRLTRNFKSIAWFENYLNNAKFKLIALDHEPNLKTAVGRFVFRQLLLIACFETEQTKERMLAKVNQMKKAGLYKGRKKGSKNKK